LIAATRVKNLCSAKRIKLRDSETRVLCIRGLQARHRGDRIAVEYDSGGMKKSIYLLAMLGLFAACEQKTTTVNPPDKKESNTTIVNPPGNSGTTTTREEKKTDINVNTSPNP